MEHSIENLGMLYDNTKFIYSNILGQTGENILSNLEDAINNLKNHWNGIDAGKQIQNLTVVYNEFVNIYNDLMRISVGMSKICKNYRNVQIAFRTQKSEKDVLRFNKKEYMPNFTDNADSIGIDTEALNSIAKLDTAVSLYESFMQQNKTYYDSITSNWTIGTGRDKLISLYDSFFNRENVYQKGLSTVTGSIKRALSNYIYDV